MAATRRMTVEGSLGGRLQIPAGFQLFASHGRRSASQARQRSMGHPFDALDACSGQAFRFSPLTLSLPWREILLLHNGLHQMDSNCNLLVARCAEPGSPSACL